MRGWYFLLAFFIQSFASIAQDPVAYYEDGQWGYKMNGDVIITPQYQYALDFKFGKGVVFQNAKAGIIDRQQNVLFPFEYEGLIILTDSLIMASNRTHLGEPRYGLLSINGRMIIPLECKSIIPRKDCFIIELSRDSIVSEDDWGYHKYMKSLYGIYSIEGNEILPTIYDRFEWLDEKTLRVKSGQYYSMVRTDGTFLTDFKYTAFGDFYNGRAKVRVDSSYGFIDTTGHEVIRPAYKMVSPFYRELTNYRKHNRRVGFVNINGVEVFEADYEILRYPHLDCAAARTNELWGLISNKGDVLIPFIHEDYVREFEGLIAFKKDGKWAIFDNQGNNLTGYYYDSVSVYANRETSKGRFWKLEQSDYDQSVALIAKDDMFGVINSHGQMVVPFSMSKDLVYDELNKIKVRNFRSRQD